MSEKPEQTNPEPAQEAPQDEDKRVSIGYRPIAAAFVAKDVIEDTVDVANATVDMATGNIKRGGSNLLKSIGSIVTAPVNFVSRLFAGKDAVKISPKYEENSDGAFEGAPVSNMLLATKYVAGASIKAATATMEIATDIINAQTPPPLNERFNKTEKYVIAAGKALVGKYAEAENITHEIDNQRFPRKRNQNEYD